MGPFYLQDVGGANSIQRHFQWVLRMLAERTPSNGIVVGITELAKVAAKLHPAVVGAVH